MVQHTAQGVCVHIHVCMPCVLSLLPQAQKLDRSMAMAYWGEAMSYKQSLWQTQDVAKARVALSALDRNVQPSMLQVGMGRTGVMRPT